MLAGLNSEEEVAVQNLIRREIETMEKILDIEIMQNGITFEKLEIIYCMTGFRRHLLKVYTSEGFYDSAELVGAELTALASPGIARTTRLSLPVFSRLKHLQVN